MQQDLDLITRITDRFASLREAEKRVATLIFEDIDFVISSNITRIAERAGVSEASVTRFSKAAGCTNVRELKLELAQSLVVGRRFIEEVYEEDSIGAVYEVAKQTLDLNRQLIEAADLEGALDLLDGARQILIFGAGGGSTALAQELQFRLMRFGYAVSAYHQALLPRMAAATLDGGDVVVALSSTGHTPEINDAVRLARRNGANTIGLTATGSPLVDHLDILLPIATRESDFVYHPSSSRYAMLAAIDVLAMGLALRHRSRSRDKLRRLKLALDAHRGGPERQPLGD
ncbi:MurR/RpiR family transcriptional regulator [Halotalea alkalilenta]|uniref:MurR/RpiR family transcriptional regulator n=1 Tax=Halotalea alkalilenta TaxID=376489 RepID=UPI0009ED4037|nr:MurR/RpiR family transcriptional regulator [Halotalea alkalilenta]